MAFKFSNRMMIVGKNLTDFHRLKGFKDGEVLSTHQVTRNDERDYKDWGIWVKCPKTGFEVRLQDSDGKLTGHGQCFEIVDTDQLPKKKAKKS